MTYTAILKITTSLPELAQECLNLFGEGAWPDATQVESFFALNNTPPQHGYCRVIVAEHIATALQWMQDNGVTSDHGELVRVEWLGQDRVQIGIDEDGQPIIEKQLFEIGVEEVLDEQGQTTGATRSVYLGRIG